jgi:hypothetical protein
MGETFGSAMVRGQLVAACRNSAAATTADAVAIGHRRKTTSQYDAKVSRLSNPFCCAKSELKTHLVETIKMRERGSNPA